MIREIANEKELENSVSVIADSFRTVAVEFNLDKDNCPTHPSLVTLKQLTEMKRKGLKLLGLFEGDAQIGFAAVEKKKLKVFNLEKLAVLPEYRHKGYGGKIIEFAEEYVKNAGGEKLSIGIINDHAVLKKWYEGKGFTTTSVVKFEHLPFTVCFMEKMLDKNSNIKNS
jgi:diamine N-acetyltransferase